MEHRLRRHSKIHLTVVEPAEKPTEEFKAKAAKMTEKFPGVTFEWHVSTFEEYQKEGGAARNESFHLVFAGHSLYYMDDWESALDAMYMHIKSDGILVVTVTRGEGKH